MRFLVPIPTVSALARLSILFIHDLLRLNSHVNNVGGVRLESTIYRKSVSKAQARVAR